MRRKTGLFLALFILGILPVFLILTNIIPIYMRMYVIFAIAFIAILFEVWQKTSLRDLGFRRDNLKESLNINFILVLILSPLIIILKISGLLGDSSIDNVWFYPFYILALAPIQEFLFRSVVFHEMKLAGITSYWLRIFFATFVFLLPHLIYRDLNIIIVSLFMGIIWNLVYDRIPNWYGVTISHIVLGVIGIATGLI